MSERIITDATGRRWDVWQDTIPADPADGWRERPLRFRRQTGEMLEAQAPAPLDELTNDELLAVLERAQLRRRDPTFGEGHTDRGQDPTGYVSD